MEKRTIGSFIAALRRANGMTQKDLAERLHVSDKTVSRWERGEGEPELSVIPVLAEIFGVTCDELLRGERRAPGDREESPVWTERGEKERRRLLRTTQYKFTTRTWIALGLSVLGLFAAAIANLAFTKALLGFCLGAAFLAASLICELIFANGAFVSVLDSELPEEEIAEFRRTVARDAWRLAAADAGLLGFLLPLATMAGTHYGLSGLYWLGYGLLAAGIALTVFGVVHYFLHASLLKKGVYSLPEKKQGVFWHNHRLKRQCALWLVPVLVLTGLVHLASTALIGPLGAAEHIVFEDYESFAAYMEQDLPPAHWSGNVAPETAVPVPAEDQSLQGGYGDKSAEEAFRSEMTNSKGEIVCSYIRRNWQVQAISYRETADGSLLPITVVTDEAYARAKQVIQGRHVIFAFAYGLELLGAVAVYFLKRKRV